MNVFLLVDKCCSFIGALQMWTEINKPTTVLNHGDHFSFGFHSKTNDVNVISIWFIWFYSWHLGEVQKHNLENRMYSLVVELWRLKMYAAFKKGYNPKCEIIRLFLLLQSFPNHNHYEHTNISTTNSSLWSQSHILLPTQLCELITQ